MTGQDRPLRRGWTTGTCAAAAAKAAYAALVTGEFPDPVEVTLPRGERPSFALAMTRRDAGSATAGVIKDAGDDPDVTHGALVLATVRAGAPGTGVIFRAGEGVGTVTRPGLPLPPGEPAINPVPRAMIRDAIAEVAAASRARRADVEVEISIPGGDALAANARSTAASASSAGCRSSAPPASSCRIPARPGSIRSIAASTSPARPASSISPARPARPRKPRCRSSTACPRSR